MKLKIHTKILLSAFILIGVFASVWHLGLKNAFVSEPTEPTFVETLDPETGEVVAVVDPNFTPPSNPDHRTGAVGSPGNPLRVSIVSFHGYGPALLANGSSLTTQASSLYADLGLSVEFIIQDDIPTLATLFGSGQAHCAWRTVDFWAQEHPGLRESGMDGQMVMVVDNTRGSDAILAAQGSNITRVEDLAGRRVALLQFTPSHWLLEYAIDNSSMSRRERERLRDNLIFVQPEDGLSGIRSMLQSGQVDAAVLWEPDLSLAMRDMPESSVIFSTETATSLIFDGMVCNTEIIDENSEAIEDFVEGWMQGVDLGNSDPSLVTEALVRTEPFFAELAQTEGTEFITNLYPGIQWTGLTENIRFVDNNDFARIYADAGSVWRRNGGVANPNSPVIPPQQAFNSHFIEALRASQPEVAQVAAIPEFEFTETEREQVIHQAEVPVITRPVSIYFASGSFALDPNAQAILDSEMVPLIQSVGSAYISVEGNTDSTGRRSSNVLLSEQRAQAVVDYLVNEWEFPESRFQVQGNGPDNPSCNTEDDDCLQQNRRTDVAVFTR